MLLTLLLIGAVLFGLLSAAVVRFGLAMGRAAAKPMPHPPMRRVK